jgi:hypothetical protein
VRHEQLWPDRFRASIDLRSFTPHPEVAEAKSFGSRANGNSQPATGIDLALWGNISQNVCNSIAGELDELPLPYTFDVQAYDAINHQPLREHIDRIGQVFYALTVEHVPVKA